MKTSILSYLRFLNPSVSGCGIKREQRYKSLSRMEILLYCCVSLLLGFSATVSVAAPPQQIAQANSPEVINRPTLQVGSKGERVTELQAALKLLGFYTGTVDGVYNESTALAVSGFQQAAGLKADGVVNATTWQQLFPNEPMVASSGSSPSTSRFPVPSETSNTNQVVVPTSNSRATTSSPRVVNSRPEPRPTTTNTTVATSKPQARARTSTTTTNNRGVNSKPEPRPATRNATASSQRTYVRQSTSTRSGSTRSEQTTRIQQSDRSGQTTRRPRSTTRSEQISAIQYTSEGLPILRVGMRGSEVVKLQQRLRRLGFLNKGDIDGDFGATTETAVIALQKRYGLNADGVVGAATWDILMRRRGG
ncbi:peptidoglycan-binding domain-containing protein [Mastigocladopsis repens]|uniref:peptidoglycan-binding domain-containing protein n=1 Tax=Mastigocladopsis repens TaxID=221287 RepID=UPI0008FC1A72|nr:peptidoglycan-binding domain-containing protein [Mastigocladopsis repens]